MLLKQWQVVHIPMARYSDLHIIIKILVIFIDFLLKPVIISLPYNSTYLDVQLFDVTSQSLPVSRSLTFRSVLAYDFY